MYQALWRRHDRFGSFDWDLGFHTQYVWQLARGRTFSSVLGLHAFGHNATFGYFLLLPIAWMGLDIAHALNLVHTVAVAATVVPVYALARRRLGDGWPAAAMAAAWLLHPLSQNMVWETFHPEVVAMPFMVGAYLAADARQWRRYWVLVALAIIWKTDVALFLVMLGIWVAVRRERRVGMATAAVAATWAVVMLLVVVPGFAGGGTVYGTLYGDLGDSPLEVARTSVEHPSRLARHVVDAEPVRYGRDLVAPYGFLPLAAPVQLLLAAPQLAVNILPTDTMPRTFDYAPHYQAVPLVALTIALVEVIGWLRRRRAALVAPACAVVVAFGLATSVAWGSLPFSVKWWYFWSEDHEPLHDAKRTAVATVSNDNGVSAQYLLTAHFAEREVVYTFPVPWVDIYNGATGTAQGDPRDIEWLVLDEGVLDETGRRVEQCIVDAGTFEEVYREREIVVLRRFQDVDPVDDRCA
jgi:uncharacterized membrane protein